MANKQDTTPRASLQAILQQDEDWAREMIRRTVQEVLEQEMTELLGAGKSERTSSRSGYRAGYYERSLVTRVGSIELGVPQDREGRFSTSVFERYQRSEKALVAALAEMYFQGVSRRKVKAVTEELCGHSVSAGTISNLVKKLDASLEAFAGRRLEEPYPYVILDARYEKVRAEGMSQSRAARGVVFHSDRGCQYTALAFSQRCAEAGIQQSMGRVGSCFDNAMAESLFATVECELLQRTPFESRQQAQGEIFKFLEGFYNRRRRHSALGYLSPVEFERAWSAAQPPAP